MSGFHTAPVSGAALTFVVPIRHQATARDWNGVRAHLANTIRSIQGQLDPRWNATIVANAGADLPPIPDGFEVVLVDFPPAHLNEARFGSPAYRTCVRRDKGRRLLTGLLRGRVGSHVMFVDGDDLVSNQLAGLVQQNVGSSGWFVDAGYLYSGGDELFLQRRNFSRLCGTSHIVRSDLLRLPARLEDADDEYVQRWLGAHVFLKGDLEKLGTPLAPLPFPGAIYRIGHANSTEGTKPLRRQLQGRARGDAEKLRALAAAVRRLAPAEIAEFFNGPPA